MMGRFFVFALFSLLLLSCSDSLENPTEGTQPLPSSPINTSSSTATPTINELKLEEISGGCGMTLSKRDRAQDNSFVFFNGLDPDSMEMKINGEVMTFRRIDEAGEAFYGQYTSQTFANADGSMIVEVDVTLGEPGEIESVAIPEGTITVTQDGQSTTINVMGGAGC